jgi:hypothetical protein
MEVLIPHVSHSQTWSFNLHWLDPKKIATYAFAYASKNKFWFIRKCGGKSKIPSRNLQLVYIDRLDLCHKQTNSQYWKWTQTLLVLPPTITVKAHAISNTCSAKKEKVSNSSPPYLLATPTSSYWAVLWWWAGTRWTRRLKGTASPTVCLFDKQTQLNWIQSFENMLHRLLGIY